MLGDYVDVSVNVDYIMYRICWRFSWSGWAEKYLLWYRYIRHASAASVGMSSWKSILNSTQLNSTNIYGRRCKIPRLYPGI